MTKTRFIIVKISLTALIIAIIYVCTAFLSIPFANGAGYFNFSDCLILFTSIYIGPLEGILSAIIGCALADLQAGAAQFIPFTIVAKGLEAIVAFLIYKPLKNHNILKYISVVIAPLFMVATYFLAYILLFDISYTFNSIFDLIQGLVGSILAITLLKLFSRIPLENLIHNKKED